MTELAPELTIEDLEKVRKLLKDFSNNSNFEFVMVINGKKYFTLAEAKQAIAELE